MSSVSTQVFRKLASGFSMPAIGIGTAYKGKRTPEIRVTVQAALDTGYRHVDCAQMYGNEEDIGEVLNEQMMKGKITREDVFVTTKLWMTEMSPERVRPAFLNSLKRLGLEYVDLYLIHWPTAIQMPLNGGLFPDTGEDGKCRYLNIDYVDTWKEMEKIFKDGLSRSIGVGNMSIAQLKRVLANAEIPPMVNQVECHPYLQNTELLEYCKSKSVTVTAYSPLGHKQGSSESWKCVLDDPVILDIAEKHHKLSAQVILRWHIQRGLTLATFSLNPEHIKSNFDCFDFELDDEDMDRIKALDQGNRWLKWDVLKEHPYHPFPEEFQ